MKVREMNYTDLLAVAELEKQCFSDPWNYKMLSGSFLNGVYHGFVLTEKEELVGYAGMTAVCEDADLDKICVLPAFRRQGGAKLLMDAVCDCCKGLAVERLFLEVRKSNESAIRLYEKYGFVPVSERKGYYENGEDAITYKKMI